MRSGHDLEWSSNTPHRDQGNHQSGGAWKVGPFEMCGLRNPAWQLAGLLHPSGELSFVDLVVLVDVEVAHFLLLGLAGREWTQRRAAGESHLDVLREAMD